MQRNCKKSLRVLAISVRADYGGGPEHLYQLAKGLIQRGVGLYVAVPKEKPYWARFAELLGEEALLDIPHRQFTLGAWCRLWRFSREKNIRLIHSHGRGAGIYGRMLSALTNTPCVHTQHGLHLRQYKTIIGKGFYVVVEKFLSRLTQKTIFVSHFERQETLGWDICRPGKSVVIPNGVRVENGYTRREARQALGLNGQEFIIISISRFDIAKNMDLALEIARRYSEGQFVWLGEGPDYQNLKKKVNEEGVANVSFIGFTDAVPLYLAASDVYLSTSRWEGLPLAVLEAMAVGLPVVVSDVMGNRDLVVPGQTGWLYPLQNIEPALQSLEVLRQDRELRRRMGAEAHKLVQSNYSIDSMVENNLDIYLETLGGA